MYKRHGAVASTWPFACACEYVHEHVFLHICVSKCICICVWMWMWIWIYISVSMCAGVCVNTTSAKVDRLGDKPGTQTRYKQSHQTKEALVEIAHARHGKRDRHKDTGPTTKRSKRQKNKNTHTPGNRQPGNRQLTPSISFTHTDCMPKCTCNPDLAPLLLDVIELPRIVQPVGLVA